MTQYTASSSRNAQLSQLDLVLVFSEFPMKLVGDFDPSFWGINLTQHIPVDPLSSQAMKFSLFVDSFIQLKANRCDSQQREKERVLRAAQLPSSTGSAAPFLRRRGSSLWIDKQPARFDLRRSVGAAVVICTRGEEWGVRKSEDFEKRVPMKSGLARRRSPTWSKHLP